MSWAGSAAIGSCASSVVAAWASCSRRRTRFLVRRVAIKVPLTEAADEIYLKRFLREARIAATLPHDHIALYSGRPAGGRPLIGHGIASRRVAEQPLGTRENAAGRRGPANARDVAAGLREAHALGTGSIANQARQHLARNSRLESKSARAKILDFGVAREARPKEGITSAGGIVGSMGYMAPEQVYAGDVDGRTDLFALGCVLYQMLTGNLPFSGSNTIASLKAVVYEKAGSAAAAAPHLSASVYQLIDDFFRKTRRPAGERRSRHRTHSTNRARTGSANERAPAWPAPPPKTSESATGALCSASAPLPWP